MKVRIFFAALLCLGMQFTAIAQQKIKVACMGNSITAGATISNPGVNGYPAQLQQLLGDGYDVRNFGQNSTTVLMRGRDKDDPTEKYAYRKSDKYKQAKAFKPDIVFIDLGGNDAKLRNRVHKADFVDYACELVYRYQHLPTQPRVILMTAIPGFTCDTTEIWDRAIVRDINPLIIEAARRMHVEVLDMHALFEGRADLLPDQIHPNDEGARLMAEKMAWYLQTYPQHPADFMTLDGMPENPFVRSIFTADPSAHVWQDGRLYVYASHDVAPPRGCDLMDGYHVFSTDDMVHWTDHGEILHSQQVTWGRKEGGYMWAPDCAYKNGKYYFYFPHPSATKTEDSWKIGVAVSRYPAKDFKVVGYIKGAPSAIDPCVFVDNDGQAYVYNGGGTGPLCFGGRLKDNMTELDGEMRPMEGLEDFHEAAYVFRRGDWYYLTYADNHTEGGRGSNRLRYAMSRHPLGPWQYKGIYLEPTDCDTSHGSVVEYKGQWYAFYHNCSLSHQGNLRSICADRLYFNADSTIQVVRQRKAYQATEMPTPPLPYQNPDLPAAERAADLCQRLTIEEKASLMQDESPAIDRLGIPPFHWWNEALHGVGRNGTATVYPIPMAMAATFNDTLVQQVFTSVSDEARAMNTLARNEQHLKRYNGLSFWTPNINIFRDPRWGRGQETYGEDPYLTSLMGTAVVRGLQGPADSRYRKLLACAKHFAVHSGPEWNRHSFNIEQLPDRDLWETYLPAFKSLVQKAGVAEVMCAYQRFDGQPCCGNSRLLQQILRDEWGFDGLVTSDCGAIDDFIGSDRHNTAPDAPHASATAVAAGTDLECGDNCYKTLPEAVRSGAVSEAKMDASLKRLLKARFELGDFDSDSLVAWTRIPKSVIASDAHHQQALNVARKSMVLLKNDGVLPLTTDKKVVVMGDNAVDASMLWGNYNGTPAHAETIWEALKRQFPQAVLKRGYALTGPTAGDSLETDADMRTAEVVVFVGGLSPRLEGEEMRVSEPGFRQGDRTTIELPTAQRDAIERLHRMGKRVVFVCCSGSAVAMKPETANANAIVQAWYAGEAGGEALGDILSGRHNPEGKLPVTFYAGDDQLPDYEDYRMQGRTYRYMNAQPLYPFGYGLSYTTFAIDKPHYHDGLLTVRVSNTGRRQGTETVQVYLKRTDDHDGPLKSLRAVAKVSLQPGESREVEIALPRERFEWWDNETNTMRVRHGRYDIMVGNSSADRDLRRITVQLPK